MTLGDVSDRADHARRPSRGVALDDRALFDPAQASIGSHDAVYDVVWRDAFKRIVAHTPHTFLVVGMYVREERCHRDGRLARHAEDAVAFA